MKQLLHKFFSRLIDFVFFIPRNPGPKLVGYGAAVLLATLGMNWLAKVRYRTEGTELSVDVSTGDGVPQVFMNIAYLLGVLLIVVGLGWALVDYVRGVRRDSRQMAIVVELRGLHSSPDTPARDADLGSLPSQRQWIQVDFRPKGDGERVNPTLLLRQVEAIKPSIETLSAGRDKGDVAIAVGGLAAVPALFLAGVLLDDESEVTIFDWHRDAKAWRVVEGPDDRRRTLPLDTSELAGTPKEVVLALSLSYPVDLDAVRKTFPGLPVAQLRAEEVRTDVYWSADKQQAFVAAFRGAVQCLMEKGVTRIHLVLASPASLAIRLGTAYDSRLMPELLVYQYERTDPVPYPWALRMPNHGQASASVITTSTVRPSDVPTAPT